MMAKRTPNQAEQLTVWDEGSIPSLTSNGAGQLVPAAERSLEHQWDERGGAPS